MRIYRNLRLRLSRVVLIALPVLLFIYGMTLDKDFSKESRKSKLAPHRHGIVLNKDRGQAHTSVTWRPLVQQHLRQQEKQTNKNNIVSDEHFQEKENIDKGDFYNDIDQSKIGSRQQLDKLAEIGGAIVEKKPSEFFSNVTFPPFVDSRDPNGLGEGGKAVELQLNTSSDIDLHKKGWDKNYFNQFLSDKISIHRSLLDGRIEECKEQALGFSSDLQDFSVVIIFHNEAWSTLLRSVHSILNRTPEHLLREIYLVDDQSTMDHLKVPLEKYFNDYPKVKLIRCTKRQGLTRARLLGFYASTAPIVVFLDSHIECFPGYAEPLLQRIHDQPKAVVFPAIPNISPTTFRTETADVTHQGIFSWRNLNFMWSPASHDVKAKGRNKTWPLRSPTMPGGLFAISREFFEWLGTYDTGLDYWGGENMELSFKVWMCGGSVEIIPCSQIGHIYRTTNPIKWNTNLGNKNAIRVAEVWMDDFKNYLYEHWNFTLTEYGDVSERKALRERLGCHTFQWYLQNVFPHVELAMDVLYTGEVHIRSKAAPKCLDSYGAGEPKMYSCHGQGYNQFWELTSNGDLQLVYYKRLCLDRKGGVKIKKSCYTNEKWEYDTSTNTLRNTFRNMCLTFNLSDDTLTMKECVGSKWQQWILTRRRTDVHFPTL